MSGIQYTVRGVPADVDGQLRREAQSEGKTLNALVVETLVQAKRPSEPHDDLDWFTGTAPDQESAEAEAEAWLDALPDRP